MKAHREVEKAESFQEFTVTNRNLCHISPKSLSKHPVMMIWLAFPGKHLSHLLLSIPVLFPILFSLFPQQQVGIVLERGRNTWEKEGLEHLSVAMQEGKSDPTLVMSKKKKAVVAEWAVQTRCF